MGELQVKKLERSAERVTYIDQLVNDIEALEKMLDRGMFEKGHEHIGAEQEFFLVDDHWMPTDTGPEILKTLNDHHFTSELAKYTLEINLDPLRLRGGCFREMQANLEKLLASVADKATDHNSRVLLCGILPTLLERHLGLEYMTEEDRYHLLNRAVKEVRRDSFSLHIKGVDELDLRHDSIMYEGANTSFQAHLQIDPSDFMNTYNWAQAIAGPVLAIAANSPMVFGRELWAESRIALFTQSVDTRASSFLLNEKESRVGFGNDWVNGSAADFYRDSMIRFRSLLTTDLLREDSLREVERGRAPKLRALNLHNGTVYKWNRVCYGVNDGKAHLRIENRYLPSGPSTEDEIANMAFWTGLMVGRPSTYDNIHLKWSFRDIKENFYHAARYGMASSLNWNGKQIPSSQLILDELLPMAHRGLIKLKVTPEDVEYYLGIIERRVQVQNGARWQTLSYRGLRKSWHPLQALRQLTAEMYARQRKGYTIDAWKPARPDRLEKACDARYVEDLMSTRIFTAQEDDSTELVLRIMEWKNIHHVPILDEKSRLKGLLTWTDLGDLSKDPAKRKRPLKELMQTEIITAERRTSLIEARELMIINDINCLPIIKGEHLIGLFTSNDIPGL